MKISKLEKNWEKYRDEMVEIIIEKGNTKDLELFHKLTKTHLNIKIHYKYG